MEDLVAWVATTRPSLWMQDFPGLVMYLQTIHILAIAMVLSAALMISLRMLRVTHMQSLAQTASRFMPWLWVGMAILAVTGLLQILAEPKRTLNYNLAFLLKMGMLIVAVGLTSAFQLSLQTNAARWEDDSRAKNMTQLFAVFMLLLWFAIAFAGRWIAYARLEVM
jgi:hypothetical protein